MSVASRTSTTAVNISHEIAKKSDLIGYILVTRYIISLQKAPDAELHQKKTEICDVAFCAMS